MGGRLLSFVMTCIGILGELAFLNDLRIYEVTNAVIEEFLKDQERFYCSGGCSRVYIFVSC